MILVVVGKKLTVTRILSVVAVIVITLHSKDKSANAFSLPQSYSWHPRAFCSAKKQQIVVLALSSSTTCSILGEIFPLRNDDDESFVSAMSVPTFATQSIQTDAQLFDETIPLQRRELQHIDHHDLPAYMLDQVLSPNACQKIIETCDSQLGFGQFQTGKNHHGALQIVVAENIVNAIAQRMASNLPSQIEGRKYCGLNRRWRVYKYSPGGRERFAPHLDAAFPPSGVSPDKRLIWDTSNGTILSRLTALFYLNDDFEAGETVFYTPHSDILESVRPQQGSCLVFPQGVGPQGMAQAKARGWPLHEGSPVRTGAPKYVIRSDVLYEHSDLVDDLRNKVQ